MPVWVSGGWSHLGTLDRIPGVIADNKLSSRDNWNPSAKYDAVMSFRVDLNCILQQHLLLLSDCVRGMSHRVSDVRSELVTAASCPTLSGWVWANRS